MDITNRAEVSADILSELIEVAIHTVLYCRGLYPAGVFGHRKKYNVPVQVCLHPEVNQYVTNISASIKDLLADDAVERVDIMILSVDQRPVERFVFNIGHGEESGVNQDEYLLHLEQSLRSLLLKLNVSDVLLQPLPAGCSWTIHVHTKQSAAIKIEEQQLSMEFPWEDADAGQQQMSHSRMVPLKSLNSHLFKVQLYAEESNHKT